MSKSISLPTMFIVYVALMLLLASTIFAGTLPLGHFAAPVALIIAGLKALLVALFFMQLKLHGKAAAVVAATGLLWLLIMLNLTLADYQTRSWLSRTEPESSQASLVPPPPGTPAGSPVGPHAPILIPPWPPDR